MWSQSWIKDWKREKFQSENLNIEIFSEKSPHATRIVAELGDAAWYGVCTQKEWISSLRSGRKILWLDARDLLPLACTVRQFNKLPPVCSHPSCSSSRIQSGNDFSGYVEKEEGKRKKKYSRRVFEEKAPFFLNDDLVRFSFHEISMCILIFYR